MATIHNEIIINASIEKIWTILTDLELLDTYDPTVKKSTLISKEKTNIGAKRKVEMLVLRCPVTLLAACYVPLHA